jgi:tripartite-type tricarboxylate transporter receptor subunit TctC
LRSVPIASIVVSKHDDHISEEDAMRSAALALSVLLLSPAGGGVQAAGGRYPDRPVRFVVPFAPGGPSDILARLVGQKLSDQLGQPVVVDNRGSVGGILGAELGAHAPPDGYTLLLGVNSLLTINPHVFKRLPYDPQRDLQPITQLTLGGNVVVVHPSVQAKSIKEFIALAKSKPGVLNYATTGAGNLLGIARFKSMAGIDMVAIPFKGTGQAAIALLANQVQFFFMNPLVAVPHVQAGRLRALAVTSMTRNPALPDIPTVAESGVPGFKNITWHSVLVPAGTPKPIVSRLNAELVKVVHLPEVTERFRSEGLTPIGSKPDEMKALIREESKEYAKLVKEIHYQPQ